MPLPAEAFEPISPYQQKIIDALNRAGANHACSACGHNEWGISSNPSQIPVLDLQGKSTREYIAVAVAVCTTCGNIRMYSLKALGFVNWKEEFATLAVHPPPAAAPAAISK